MLEGETIPFLIAINMQIWPLTYNVQITVYFSGFLTFISYKHTSEHFNTQQANT